jgi:hypothetical protein
LISEDTADRADLGRPQHFPRADALQAKVELRVNLRGLVREETEFLKQGETDLHGLSPVRAEAAFPLPL